MSLTDNPKQIIMPFLEEEEHLQRSIFIKAEANLETLGFFTPSSKTLKKHTKKVITFKRKIDSQIQELKITILPSAEYGLPNSLHQDIYRAFQKILTDKLRKDGKITKHITFTTAELLANMGKSRKLQSGKWYNLVLEWLKVMHLTGVESKLTIWDAKNKRWVSDTVHVFERVVELGKRLEDGTIAHRHHVWLSDWQYNNINEHYLLSINYDLYKQLKRNIAKSLFSILHCWFYVGEGKFTKGYQELCQWLGIRQQRKMSLIKQQLDPSHQELQRHGFLKTWKYTTSDKSIFITWYAGDKYYQNRTKKLETQKPKPLVYEQTQIREQIKVSQTGKQSAFNQEAYKLVDYFHEKLGHQNYRPTKKELDQAQSLLDDFGEEKAKFIVDWALKEAPKTNFQMKTFGAVNTYLYEAAYSFEKERQKKLEAERLQRIREENERLKKEYEEFISQKKSQAIKKLTAEQLAIIKKKAKEEIDKNSILKRYKSFRLYKIVLEDTIEKLALEALNEELPSFEVWVKIQRLQKEQEQLRKENS